MYSDDILVGASSWFEAEIWAFRKGLIGIPANGASKAAIYTTIKRPT